MKNNKLTSFTKTMAKVMEVILLLAAGLCLIGAIVTWFAMSPALFEKINSFIQEGVLSIENELLLQMEGYETVRIGAVIACLSGFVTCILGGMIFRNIVKIFKNVEETRTPFTKENAKLVRHIGIYAIATPFVDGVFKLIISAVCNVTVTINIEVTTLVMGLIVLCLAGFFDYGVGLEDEVEGMI